MTTMKRPSISNVPSALNRLQDSDLRNRQEARNILSPDAIAGKTSPAKLLMTRRGGELHRISNEDLAAFQKAAKALGSKVSVGMTAQEITDLSAPADRQRARTQIRTAIATRLRAGEIIFTTDAGPDSKSSRHFVTVKFPAYDSIVAMPAMPMQAAAELSKLPLKFDCDCFHHVYRYRYITSILGIAANRIESGYPKLTNSALSGCACKHVLRTLVELTGSMLVRGMMARMLEADRARLTPKARVKPRVITATAAQADRAASQRVRSISTTEERERKALVAGIRAAMPKATAGPMSRDLATTLAELKRRPDVSARALLAALQSVLATSSRSSA